MTRTRTTLEELREHVELADHNHLASEREIDERLDCALDCATQLLAERLEASWSELRTELEDAHGVPYIYAEIRGGWYIIPPLFAEIEGSPIGYALSPLLPSAPLLLRQLAQSVARRELINLANDEEGVTLLIAHAFAPPVVLDQTREQVIDCLISLATTPSEVDRETMGAWGRGLTRVTLLHSDGTTYSSNSPDHDKEH